MVKRSFEELSVAATGVQTLQDRFGKRRRYEYDDLPPISQWRCNLTALSQEHNLYFVAHGRDIYVYVPQYPTQRLPATPAVTVPSLPSAQCLRGHLDPREPHTINNLIVQHLGNDEVVATVRDDGDVDAVLLRHVVQAIERRAEVGSTLGVVADEVRPMFQSNVGKSAWGLAIHTEARILATSSNAHEVRVFKFGLLREAATSFDDAVSDESPHMSSTPPSATSSCNVDSESLPPSAGNQDTRELDVTQRVLNGDANIPHIAFCNTGHDRDGRWLLTTDVSGYCRVMDLHCTNGRDVTAQQFRFGRSFLSHERGFDRLNAGWGVMFLDPRSFKPEKNLHAALGLTEGESLPGLQGSSRIWDLSDTVDHVPDLSHSFAPSNSEPRSTRDVNSGRSSDPPSSPYIENDIFNDDDDYAENSSDEYASPSHEFTEDPDYEPTEDSISISAIYSGKRIFANTPSFQQPSQALFQNLPCPILHVSVKNLYLLQPSQQAAFTPPMVGMANPLRQGLPPELGYLNMFDRMNMHAYIPSLGVVVIASQKGRALVLDLTKLAASVPYSPEMQGPDERKTDYAMRVECILPFARQERAKERPFRPLHGIAVGPVQGTERAREARKRWRLMLHYQDHSVLSYEIGRARGRDSAVEVEGLVV